MRIFAISLAVLVTISLPALAADQPRIEIFGGYSYLYMPQDFSLNTAAPHDMNLSGNAEGGSSHNGWNASLAYNLTKNLALVADTSGHYQFNGRNIRFSGEFVDNLHSLSINADSKTHSFLFGPRVRILEDKKLSPFVHVLLGVTRMDRELRGVDTMSVFSGVVIRPIRETRTDTGFAFAMGGGVDLRCSDRISVRLIQADYMRSEREVIYDKSLFPDPFTKDSTRNGLRISTGIIINVGKR
jgi:opacity protein-like surface antigen